MPQATTKVPSEERSWAITPMSMVATAPFLGLLLDFFFYF
jgi:hypothetical protein